MSTADRLERLGEGERRSFFNRASIGGKDACWVWQGARTGAGYGVIARVGKMLLAHRVSYRLAHACDLSREQQLHHICQNRACVNPNHLMLVTQYEHGQEHRPTHCKRGHEFTPENTIVKSQGWHVCRTCKRADDRRRWREKHGSG